MIHDQLWVGVATATKKTFWFQMNYFSLQIWLYCVSQYKKRCNTSAFHILCWCWAMIETKTAKIEEKEKTYFYRNKTLTKFPYVLCLQLWNKNMIDCFSSSTNKNWELWNINWSYHVCLWTRLNGESWQYIFLYYSRMKIHAINLNNSAYNEDWDV